MYKRQGLWFDEEKRIQLVFDHDVKREGRIAFHPCDNTATVVFAQEVMAATSGRAVRNALKKASRRAVSSSSQMCIRDRPKLLREAAVGNIGQWGEP